MSETCRDWLLIVTVIPAVSGAAVLTCWATAEQVWWLAVPLWVGLLAFGLYADSMRPANIDPGERWD